MKTDRATLLKQALAIRAGQPLPLGHEIVPHPDDCGDLSAHCIYAIPVALLDALSVNCPGMLTAEEFVLERRFAVRCEQEMRSMGILHGRFVQHCCLSRLPPRPVNSEHVLKLGNDTTPEQFDQAMGLHEDLGAPVIHRLEAYLGWLVTNPLFLREVESLRQAHGSLTAQLEEIPGYRATVLRNHLRWPAGCSEERKDQIIADLTNFYTRWQLTHLATWELPEPLMPNLGAPASHGLLMGLAESPALQVPTTLKLPDQFPLDTLHRQPIDHHLEEWLMVQEERHPDGFGYDRFRRIWNLHVVRDIFLQSAFPDRFKGRVQQLDYAFSAFLGVTDESVKKLRLWIARRLRSAA